MKNEIAIVIALIFFIVTAVLVSLAAYLSIYLIYIIIALAILGAIYVQTGGRARFGTHEHPDRILGVRVRFSEVDGLTKYTTTLPSAIIRTFENGTYHAEFVEPFEWESTKESFVDLSPRHVGYPISKVRKRGVLAVCGILESGRQFISLLNRE